ncbi:hypothetical protein LK07_23725 [Streptomyces pluripotens]|uniref:FXSXX-COOH protein n=1 Tax=Streptomyces pluripotens TaxID=1355015 RepID=A0A221P2T4_9ACTN|nr:MULTISPECIES: hypothetical protein [Streptomyces]ARP72271.1 hypothetical protein LK06_022560 [Streptomyces pluripotens]ASN26520.1 hypothetical protein LK07_23725 [Streptomyces pluripotens]KIE27178.1 hypothetical protein LK08_09605 [Streptomyces sp. MUSC 125]MCH0556155.1 hypothetical protein [Streptomyces sp. MUM 16J]
MRTVLPADLTDVDLRTLRAMEDPDLMTAVVRVLYEAGAATEVWYVSEDPPTRMTGAADRMFPAGLAGADRSEDTRG